VREVVAAHRFDEARLEAYLRTAIPDFGDAMTVRQFQGGASNPTFTLNALSLRGAEQLAANWSSIAS